MMREVCFGWEYEFCGEIAEWSVYDEDGEGTWRLYDLCSKHVASAFAHLDSKTYEPRIRAVARQEARETLLTRMWRRD